MNLKTSRLLTTALGAGVLGFCIRWALYCFGFDEKNILSATHPLHLLCLVLTLALAVYLILAVRKLGGSSDPVKNFPDTPLRSMAALAAACLMTVHGLSLGIGSPLATVRAVLTLGSAVCMALCAMPGMFRRGLHGVLLGIVSIFFAVDMLCRYQSWSGNPQLPDYTFQVFACVLLTLCSYHRLAFHVGLGKRRGLLLCSLTGLYLCLVCAAGPETRAFYLGGAFWAGACICSAQPPALFLPDYVTTCIDALENAGYQAWAVGGCVRDAILGLTPNDYDLCTNALPEQTESVFSDYPLILNGKKHGTVGVILDKNVVEITTFRTEGDYKDNRHPEWVKFVPNIEADLARRDFTVNAMAYSPKRGFADPFGGQEDLQNKVLRAVGDPAARFREDSLRILRGARFAVKYRFTPDPATEKAMEELAPLMDNLARERVFDELCKLILLADAADLLRFAPVIAQVIPELRPQLGYDQNNHHHIHDLYTHTAYVTAAMPAQLHLRWAALLHDTGKPESRTLDDRGEAHYHGHAQISAALSDQALTRLKAPTVLREQVVLLVDKHMVWFPLEKKVIRRWISKLGFELFSDLITLQSADCLATGTAGDTEPAHFVEIRRLAEEIRAEGACLTLKDLAVSGHDLMALGLRGKEIGETLNRLLNAVLEEELPNEKEALLRHVQESI